MRLYGNKLIKYHIRMFTILWHWLAVTWYAGKPTEYTFFSKGFI